MSTAQCPTCFGRGYRPQYRKGRMGFYARTCSRCGDSGSIHESKLRKSERPVPIEKGDAA